MLHAARATAYKKPSFQKPTKKITIFKQNMQKLSEQDHPNPIASPSMTDKRKVM